MGTNKYSRAAAMTLSGIRRYPRAMMASLRNRPGPPPPLQTQAQRIAAFSRLDTAAIWLGHASVLLRVGGATILTDPVFSHRVGLRLGPLTMGVARLCPVPVHLAELPQIDLILLSHAHFDHLDRPTLARLVSPTTSVITARKTSRLVPKGFRQVIELDWEEELVLTDLVGLRRGAMLRVSAIRPAHWGARFAYDRHRGFNSYMLRSEGSTPASVLFAGDTAVTNAFHGMGPVDLAVFGIGAYDPWNHAHANPEQVWSMFQALGGNGTTRSALLPMHHSTFKLSEEHVDEPMQRLLAAAGSQQDRIVARAIGDLWTPGAAWVSAGWLDGAG